MDGTDVVFQPPVSVGSLLSDPSAPPLGSVCALLRRAGHRSLPKHDATTPVSQRCTLGLDQTRPSAAWRVERRGRGLDIGRPSTTCAASWTPSSTSTAPASPGATCPTTSHRGRRPTATGRKKVSSSLPAAPLNPRLNKEDAKIALEYQGLAPPLYSGRRICGIFSLKLNRTSDWKIKCNLMQWLFCQWQESLSLLGLPRRRQRLLPSSIWPAPRVLFARTATPTTVVLFTRTRLPAAIPD